MMFLNPRTWLVLVLAIALGFGAGFYTSGKFAVAAEATQRRNDVAATAAGIEMSIVKSQELETKAAASDGNISNIRAAIHKRGITLSPTIQENPNDAVPRTASTESDAQADGNCSNLNLDRGTVWLLNAAREGTIVESIPGGNEALLAPSTVALTAFIDNDLDVVKLYRDLATRHDQLVDEVEQKLKQQAGDSSPKTNLH